jgi:leucyl-tRNA synthetase
VSPDTIIQSHGTDSLRLYLMFLGPLEAMKPWNPRGIEGVHRFLQKIWRELIAPDGTPSAKVFAGTHDSPELTRLLHETIRKVGDDIENLRFNTAISQMMILVNGFQRAKGIGRGTALSFLQLLAPFAPHIAEELWNRLGGQGSVMSAPWPVYEPERLANTEVKLVFQINGKHRGDQSVPVGTTQESALELAKSNPRLAPHLAGKAIKRVIYVPGKILNIVLE